MKPSITIDERGVILHVTTDAGEGIAVPLEPATVLELAAALERGRAALKTPAGWSKLLRGAGRLLLELSEEDGDRKQKPKA